MLSSVAPCYMPLNEQLLSPCHALLEIETLQSSDPLRTWPSIHSFPLRQYSTQQAWHRYLVLLIIKCGPTCVLCYIYLARGVIRPTPLFVWALMPDTMMLGEGNPLSEALTTWRSPWDQMSEQQLEYIYCTVVFSTIIYYEALWRCYYMFYIICYYMIYVYITSLEMLFYVMFSLENIP